MGPLGVPFLFRDASRETLPLQGVIALVWEEFVFFELHRTTDDCDTRTAGRGELDLDLGSRRGCFRGS